MATYDAYTTVGIPRILTLGLRTGQGVTVNESDGVLGDSERDTFSSSTGILPLLPFRYEGTLYDDDGNPVGFVASQLPLVGDIVYTTFVPEGQNPSGLNLTLFPSDTLTPETQWDVEAGGPVCFMPGTMVRTPSGDVAVETLKAGDIVVTADGKHAPIRWIGLCTVSRRFADPMRALPVRIKAGALGDNVPSADLLVSPDHALMVDGLLVQAGALVNGVSICRETDTPETFVYYHVEMHDHSLVLAENTPAETFVDNVSRMRFDNWAEHEAIHGSKVNIAEMNVPRVKSSRQLPQAIRARLQARVRDLFANAAAQAA